jgi:hypothetical protein
MICVMPFASSAAVQIAMPAVRWRGVMENMAIPFG